jgi:tetratricopeptide (TPR) repeat protein
MGAHAKAIADYDEAIRRGSTGGTVYLSRGIAHHESGDYDKAIADFDEAIRRDPENSGGYNNRAMSHRKKGDLTAAIADYEMAIKLDRDSGYAYSGLAWIWATATDPSLRDGKKAVAYAQKGCELTEWAHPYGLNVLAAAYAEVGRFDHAVRWQAKALDFSESFPPAEAEKARFRLKLYQASQAYRE